MSTFIILPDPIAPFAKSIFPVFEPCGKRRQMIGYGASLNEEILTVPGSICPALFDCYLDAERALDAAALEAIEAESALPFEPSPAELAEVTREYVADVPSIGGAPVELVQEVAAELAHTCHQSGDTRGREIRRIK